MGGPNLLIFANTVTFLSSSSFLGLEGQFPIEEKISVMKLTNLTPTQKELKRAALLYLQPMLSWEGEEKERT